MSNSLLRSVAKEKNKEKDKLGHTHDHVREQKERPARLSLIVIILSAVVCLTLLLFAENILAIHLTISPTSAPSSSLNEPTRNSLQGQKPVAVLVSNPSVVNIDLGISSERSKKDVPVNPIPADKTIASDCTTESKQPLYLLSHAEICKDEDVRAYRVSGDRSSEKDDRAWCIDSRRKHHVVIGHSWGSLRKDQILKWDKVNCNELLKVGKRLPCSRRWGWQFFEEWLSLPGEADQGSVQTGKTKMATLQHIISEPSTVLCAVNFKASAFCKLNNVRVDFSKMQQLHLVRSFSPGFVTVFGKLSGEHSLPNIPGVEHLSGPVRQDFLLPSRGYCDVVESRPTFILSNDDIFNLGHFSNDLMNIWNMLVLANKDSKQSLLINIDGYRVGGPAGGPAHRMMVPEQPDSHGPYVGYYESWFAEVKKAVDFKGRRVCFTGGLFLPPDPGVAWFWNDWGQVNDCSMQAASPLYQSFNLFLRERWQAHFGPAALIYPAEVHSDYRTVLAEKLKLASPPPSSPPPSSSSAAAAAAAAAVKNVHVVIEVRSINRHKRNNHSSARHIANLAALIAALKAIEVDNVKVTVTAQDFAKLSFAEQVRLSHSASVFLSMHGAGTTHIFHMAVGQSSCCALVEMFPDSTIEFQSAQGYGNIARMLGLHHYRYEASLGTTRPEGTTVDALALQRIVRQAVQAVVGRPTCLHDVRDTRCPIYRNGTLT